MAKGNNGKNKNKNKNRHATRKPAGYKSPKKCQSVPVVELAVADGAAFIDGTSSSLEDDLYKVVHGTLELIFYKKRTSKRADSYGVISAYGSMGIVQLYGRAAQHYVDSTLTAEARHHMPDFVNGLVSMNKVFYSAPRSRKQMERYWLDFAESLFYAAQSGTDIVPAHVIREMLLVLNLVNDFYLQQANVISFR